MSCNLYFLRDLFNIYIWDRIHRDRIHWDQIYRDRIYRSPCFTYYFNFFFRRTQKWYMFFFFFWEINNKILFKIKEVAYSSFISLNVETFL